MTDESDKKDKIAKLKLRRIIRDLSKKRARHTEFISVYVPTGYNIQGIIDQISSELGTARNIKTTSTRKNVTGALEKMLQTLRLYKKTPEHGLAIFTGNISEREGQTDIQVWEIEPSEDLRVKMYKCDQVFYLEPLMEQLETKIVYGLLVMDRREANLALLKGKHIIPLMKLDSMVPGKFRVGGQSAQRFARTIEGMAKDWYKKIGDKAVESFKPNEIAGLIVGGPGPTKEDFVKGDFMSTDLKKKILAVKNIGYTDEYGLKELVERSEDILKESEAMLEKKAVEKILMMLATRKELVAKGEDVVRRALEMGAVSEIIISEELEEKVFDELVDKAYETGANVITVTNKTQEGKQIESLGKVAAILRYALA
ncbi:MAG: peptide chain release factor aRF-1 [DPANN group archaeon]|nr:peptide chain release factor aRF-1 [DPANN group archaeon]